MDKDWIKLYSSSDATHLKMIHDLLTANGVECIIMNKQDSAYLVFGEVELYVRKDDVVLSKHILNKADDEE